MLADDAVELIEHGIVVVGVGEDQAPLPLRIEVVDRIAWRFCFGHQSGVDDVGEAEDIDGYVGAVGIAEVRINLVPTQGLVEQQTPLCLPAIEVVQGLQVRDIALKLAPRKLIVDACVMILAEVDEDADVHSRKARFEGVLVGRLPIGEITPGIRDQVGAFGERGLVELLQRSGLDLGHLPC